MGCHRTDGSTFLGKSTYIILSMAEFRLRKEIVLVKNSHIPVKSLEVGDETWVQSLTTQESHLQQVHSLGGWGVEDKWSSWEEGWGCLETRVGSSAVEESWKDPPGKVWAESLRLGMPVIHLEAIFFLLLWRVHSVHKLLCDFLEFEQGPCCTLDPPSPKEEAQSWSWSWACQSPGGLLKSWKGHGMGARPGSSRHQEARASHLALGSLLHGVWL